MTMYLRNGLMELTAKHLPTMACYYLIIAPLCQYEWRVGGLADGESSANAGFAITRYYQSNT